MLMIPLAFGCDLVMLYFALFFLSTPHRPPVKAFETLDGNTLQGLGGFLPNAASGLDEKKWKNLLSMPFGHNSLHCTTKSLLPLCWAPLQRSDDVMLLAHDCRQLIFARSFFSLPPPLKALKAPLLLINHLWPLHPLRQSVFSPALPPFPPHHQRLNLLLLVATNELLNKLGATSVPQWGCGF